MTATVVPLSKRDGGLLSSTAAMMGLRSANKNRTTRRASAAAAKPRAGVVAVSGVSSSSSFKSRSSAVLSSSRATSWKGQTRTTRETKTNAFVDPWGVTDAEYTTLEANLFAASLFPYLFFLFFLGKPETAFPKRALFGFKFLLVFVFATIPAGIYAKVHYSDILANVDWLHGGAESLLTITNLLIVLGMREGLRDAEREAKEERENGTTTRTTTTDGGAMAFSSVESRSDSEANRKNEEDKGVTSNTNENGLNINSTFSLAGLTLLVVGAAALVSSSSPDAVAATTDSIAEVADGNVVSSLIASAKHGEPGNALSLPTWVIHASSLIEWLVAMSLIWNYADVKKRPSYKGLTWGMVTSHASGLAACTFHVFYNSPTLNSVVALQAGLTCLGNATMGIAAFRMYQEGKRLGIGSEEDGDEDAVSVLAGSKALQTPSSTSFLETDAFLLLKLLAVSTAVSAAVKWGSLFVDFPFEPSLFLAYSMIVFPTMLNVNAWKNLSDDPTKKADSLL